MNSWSSLSSSTTHFILLQSSAAQTALPVLRELIKSHIFHNVFVLCSLYAPSKLVDKADDVRAFDWTAAVPGYSDTLIDWDRRLAEVEDLISKSDKPPCIFIDSVDTIVSDFESASKAYAIVKKLLELAVSTANRKTQGRQQARLVAHLTSLCDLLPQLKQLRFSASLTHIVAHPPALLAHMMDAYLISPPVSSSSSNESDFDPETLKFWRVFTPISERPLEIEQLVFGQATSATQSLNAGGSRDWGSISDEIVIEIVSRHRGGASSLPASIAAPRRKNTGVARVLQGWSLNEGLVQLEQLKCLKGLWKDVANSVRTLQNEPDPTRNLTFNLSLTESQQASRAQVPLPYEHDGKAQPPSRPASAQIFYDPDSADDIDDEDPDEDLDI